MDIFEICRLTGLTKGWVAQLISRSGFRPNGPLVPGQGRVFNAADAFLLSVAARLWKLGLDQPQIVSVLRCFVWTVDPTTDRITEIFPRRAVVEAGGRRALLVAFPSRKTDRLEAFIVPEAGFSVPSPSIIIDVSEIAREVEIWFGGSR